MNLDFLKNIPETTRAYFYRIVLAVLALLIAYGVIDDGEAAVWIQIIAAILAIGAPALATVNTSRTAPETEPPEFP